ncbi:MAG: CCA tRNA nucleotidyltransferase [Candidatus Bathyarchaeota archaeon]|nr:CCA tRNA nucleotidyltransferase [Candidatus Bathyarchaeota archaeon]
MPWTGDWAELRTSVLEQIVPEEDERGRVEATCRRIEEGLTGWLRGAGLRAVAEVHGSVAHGTWLSGERDIDVFLVLDGGYNRGVLPRVLDVVKGYVGEGWVEAYAEHPYISALVDGFNVDFVPCFRVDPKRGLISSTDRTPLHTGYLSEHLRAEMRDEVRLLKKFMKGIEVYGAEVRVGGFSGYLCELLVIRLGSFEGVIRGASSWGRGQVLDLVGGADEGALRRRFGDPLIVVDPVDPNRNVASAVSETSFWTLVAAARGFLRRPEARFFEPSVEEVDSQQLAGEIRGWGSALLFLVIDDDDVDVPDVLWGQLYRTERALRRLLEKHDFGVMRSAAWSDESSRHFLVFELESAVLPGNMKRAGPPVGMEEDGDRFLRTHLGAADTVSGPWIEGDRWWVDTRRPEPDARRLLSSTLEDGGRGTGVSRKLMGKIRRGHRVLLGEEIAGFLDPGFAGFLDRFLKGRPAWLE